MLGRRFPDTVPVVSAPPRRSRAGSRRRTGHSPEAASRGDASPSGARGSVQRQCSARPAWRRPLGASGRRGLMRWARPPARWRGPGSPSCVLRTRGRPAAVPRSSSARVDLRSWCSSGAPTRGAERVRLCRAAKEGGAAFLEISRDGGAPQPDARLRFVVRCLRLHLFPQALGLCQRPTSVRSLRPEAVQEFGRVCVLVRHHPASRHQSWEAGCTPRHHHPSSGAPPGLDPPGVPGAR